MNDKKRVVTPFSVLLLCIIVFLGMISANCYIKQYENNYKCKVLNSELDKVIQEGDFLRIEYEACMNLRDVEDYVSENLLMNKLNSYQIQYIVSTNTNKLESVSEEEDPAFFERVVSTLSVIAEYFN